MGKLIYKKNVISGKPKAVNTVQAGDTNLVTSGAVNDALAEYAINSLNGLNQNNISEVGGFSENNKFSNWTASRDCVIIAQVSKNNEPSSQNVRFYVNGNLKAFFAGLVFPYTSGTYYIPMKKNDVLTISCDGNWAYHIVFLSFY